MIKISAVNEIKVEKIDDKNVPKEVKSSKSPEATKSQLKQNVRKPQFLSNIHSSTVQ